MERKAFGKLADGEEATLYTISNTKGMYAQITDFGASIVSLVVKDKDGKNTDVVLGYENAETYQQQMASFGAVVGRNCNRIANAEIVIDGVTYQLEKNDNENNLHSGSQATSRRLWDAEEQTADKITFVIKDAEGQQGYPGNAVMKVTYEVTEANELSITYHATADKTTIFNMTNHAKCRRFQCRFNPDNRNIRIHLAQFPDSSTGGCIAGNHKTFCPLVKQLSCTSDRQFPYFFFFFCSVWRIFRIPEINKIFLRHNPDQFPQDTDSSHSGVKYRNWVFSL